MRGSWARPVYVAGAAALTGWGLGWHGLAEKTRRLLAPAGGQAATLGPEAEPCEARQRKLMSRAAYLAAAIVKGAMEEARAARPGLAPEDVGCFFGVGASGGEVAELEAMLAASVVEGALRFDRFGEAGIRAANPLFAFQLMNNFTLCHAAILSGLQGPNAAFFSRGAGTVTALCEAAHAVASGDASLALAGGADSALHPVTTLELDRAGLLDRGLVAAEGAACLTLEACPRPETARVRLGRVEVVVTHEEELTSAASVALGPTRVSSTRPRVVVLAAWGQPARDAFARATTSHATDAELLFANDVLGETLAAAPALAWAVAVDWLSERTEGEALVLTAGIDGQLGVVELMKEAP